MVICKFWSRHLPGVLWGTPRVGCSYITNSVFGYWRTWHFTAAG